MWVVVRIEICWLLLPQDFSHSKKSFLLQNFYKTGFKIFYCLPTFISTFISTTWAWYSPFSIYLTLWMENLSKWTYIVWTIWTLSNNHNWGRVHWSCVISRVVHLPKFVRFSNFEQFWKAEIILNSNIASASIDLRRSIKKLGFYGEILLNKMLSNWQILLNKVLAWRFNQEWRFNDADTVFNKKMFFQLV